MNYQAIKIRATAWINAWNERDINVLMDHYADDAELLSPAVVRRWQANDGKLVGKEKIREHFSRSFDAAPDLRFTLIDLLAGVDGFILLYINQNGDHSADLIELNDAGKVKRVKAFYSSNHPAHVY